MLTRVVTSLGFCITAPMLVSCDDGDCPGKGAEIRVNVAAKGTEPPISMDKLVPSSSINAQTGRTEGRTLDASFKVFGTNIPAQEVEGTEARFGDVTLRAAQIEIDGEVYTAVMIKSDHAATITVDSESTP